MGNNDIEKAPYLSKFDIGRKDSFMNPLQVA
jgi:hypothetical protein